MKKNIMNYTKNIASTTALFSLSFILSGCLDMMENDKSKEKTTTSNQSSSTNETETTDGTNGNNSSLGTAPNTNQSMNDGSLLNTPGTPITGLPAVPTTSLPLGGVISPPNLIPTDCPATSQIGLPGTIELAGVSVTPGVVPVIKDSTVKLNLYRDEALEMKISLNGSCTCGTWEKYSTEKSTIVPVPNSLNQISVQYKDYDHAGTICASVSFIHDNAGPVASLTRLAGPLTLGSTISFSLSATDSGSGLDHFECFLNDQSYSCNNLNVTSGAKNFNAQLDIPNLPVNVYKLTVRTVDNAGNSSDVSHPFEIVPSNYLVNQDLIVKNNKMMTDILFVVDNSGSMEYEQRSMDQRINHFMTMISDLDYQIAVTTTDPRNSVYGDGNFVNFNEIGLKILTPNDMSLENAQAVLGKTLKRTEAGASDEQGIFVTYRAIERSKTAGSPQQKFFRPQASLVVILISDEDESGCGSKNDPAGLVNFVKATWPGKSFSFHSIITIPNDATCLKTNGAAYGKKYQELSKLLGYGTVGGSLIGSVCASDYASQLTGIGQSVQDMSYTAELKCAPVVTGNSSVEIYYQGSKFNGNFAIQGTKLVFDQLLSDGSYSLKYNCSK